MGYDMELVKKDPAKVAKHRELVEKAIAMHEAEKGVPNELWEEADAVQKEYYFRLNIWGMGTMRRVMNELGMLDLFFQHEPFVKWEGEEPTIVEEAENERILAAFNSAIALPPLHKFGSNDGWVVTPMECNGMLEMWKKAGEQGQRKAIVLATSGNETEEWFKVAKEFMEFVERAAANGGFRVY